MTDNNKLFQSISKTEARVLQNKGYKILRELGVGGYAKVYLGEYSPENHEAPYNLACKIVNTAKAPKRYVLKFLPRELKMLAKIKHPYIIQVHSIFYRKKKYYIFMRHAERGDLLEYILQHGAVGQSQARVWTRQMALAVQYLHILDIAHRDLKCENMLITANYNIKLSDFGFSKCNVDTSLSETFCGSLSYAPPEILDGEPYNPKVADMWSFGIVIYTMLNKANPFDTKNLKILHTNQLQKRWEFRSQYKQKVAEDVITLIGHLLEPSVDRRYTIEDVITSSWIAMDSKLKVLNPSEYQALSAAIQEMRSHSVAVEKRKERLYSSTLKKVDPKRNSLTFFKEYDGGFDLQHIRSDYNQREDLQM